MSVIRFDKEEISNIYKSLKWLTYGYNNAIDRVIPFNYSEYLEAKSLDEKHDYESFIQEKLVNFIDRLWLSNQMAFILQYGRKNKDHREIEFITDADLDNGKQLPNYELYSQLNSLRYNLYTNGGNSFIQQKDLEFLEGIISGLERREARRKFEEDKKSIEAMRKRLAEVKT